MNTWILILTVWYNGTYEIRATSVPGFTSSQACQTAYSLWHKGLPDQARYHGVCAKQGT